MNRIRMKTKCIMVVVIICSLICSVNAGLISGKEPKGGLNSVIFDNTLGNSDTLINISEDGWPIQICSIIIPKGEKYQINTMKDGDYIVDYAFGNGWNPKNKEFINKINIEGVISLISFETVLHYSKDSMSETHHSAIINMVPINELANNMYLVPTFEEQTATEEITVPSVWQGNVN